MSSAGARRRRRSRIPVRSVRRPVRSTQAPSGTTRPVSSATGDELGRRQQPPPGMLPADQRLDAGPARLAEVDDPAGRCTRELVGVDAPGGAPRPSGPRAWVRSRATSSNTSMRCRPRLLGPVHGDVGVAQQGVGGGVGPPGEGDADAGRATRPPGRRTSDRAGRGRPAPARPPATGGPVALEVLAQHDELVAAEAGHGVARPQHLAAAGSRRPAASRRRRRGRSGR